MKKNKNQQTLFFGLINKKERLGLSWKGWISGVLISISFFVFFLKNIYPFLAPINRVESKVLVVEGWMNDEDMKEAVNEFKSYKYEQIYVTGSPLEKGFFLSEYKNLAELGTATLKKLGLDSSKVIAVPGPGTARDRTYTSALVLKKYFEDHKINVKSFNLFSSGPHSKRSQFLFNLAFKNKVKIGIIAQKNPSFEAESWWRSSAGVRTIISEFIDYTYALFFKYTHLGIL